MNSGKAVKHHCGAKLEGTSCGRSITATHHSSGVDPPKSQPSLNQDDPNSTAGSLSKKGNLQVPRRKRPITEASFEPINRWWEKETSLDQSGNQWTYLEHRGPIFAPPYAPHGVPVVYQGTPYLLPNEGEEIINFWIGTLNSEYPNKPVFVNNAWKAFQSKLDPTHPLSDPKRGPKTFFDLDYSAIQARLEGEREAKKNRTPEEKERAKRDKETLEERYLHAIVDSIREQVGSLRVEPPGLFRGRGEHPKQGQLKRRVFPEDVTLNLALDAPVPRVIGVPGHAWGNIVCEPTVTWLAYYKDTINDQIKYTYLAAQSKFKGLSDFHKYEKARRLKHFVDKIRSDYREKMQSSEPVRRQLGTATYLIDFLALRAGGDKDPDEEADTVGCCSLRVEHISFHEPTHEITLDFLGKDSIRYLNTVKLYDVAFKNLQEFCASKAPDQNLFDHITVSSLNAYLKELMPGLSAKVFRTYNASHTLESELAKLPECNIDISDVNTLLQFYNSANRQVAILCNHQRSVPKQHEAAMGKLEALADSLKSAIGIYRKYIKWMKNPKAGGFTYPEAGSKVALKPGTKVDVAKRRMAELEKRKRALETRITDRESNKTVALGTSKINYMDPRISVAFCKNNDIPIEKIFNKSLRLKFPWAMYAPLGFRF